MLADKIRALAAPADISAVMEQVNALLDRSIATDEGYIISAPLPNVIREADNDDCARAPGGLEQD